LLSSKTNLADRETLVSAKDPERSTPIEKIEELHRRPVEPIGQDQRSLLQALNGQGRTLELGSSSVRVEPHLPRDSTKEIVDRQDAARKNSGFLLPQNLQAVEQRLG